MIDYSFLISGKAWSSGAIADLEFNFAEETPSYLHNELDDEDFDVTNDDGTEFSGLSSASAWDQKDAVRYFLLPSGSLSSFTGDDTINSTLVSTANTSVGMSTVNYRVSFSDVISAGFSEDADGEVQLVNHEGDDAETLNRGFYPGGNDEAGDIVINNLDPGHDDLQPGQSGFWVLLHELGHAVGGLDHVDVGEPDEHLDSQKYTVMSYNGYGGVYASGLGLLDIAALQDTYGTFNTSTRSGNTEYAMGQGLGFAGADEDTAFLYTIWDGGGVDTISAVGFDVPAEIDLRQGRFSSIGKTALLGGVQVEWEKDASAPSGDPDPGNVAIAYGTIIENAVGTSLQDNLIGNAWSNILTGGGGNDNLYGDGILYDGQAGYYYPGDPPSVDNDYLDGGSGDDTLYLGYSGLDYVDGGTHTSGDKVVVKHSFSGTIQVGGTYDTLLPGHHVVGVEEFETSAESAPHFRIHALGQTYDSGNTITLDYSGQSAALTAALGADTITIGSNTDTLIGGEAEIVGTNKGDTFSGTGTEFSSLFTGTGDDAVSYTGIWGSTLSVHYTNGDDTIAGDGPRNVILPAGIEAGDISYSVVNVTGPVPGYDSGMVHVRDHYTADIRVEIAGLGSITFEDAYWYHLEFSSGYYDGDALARFTLQTASGRKTFEIDANFGPTETGPVALSHSLTGSVVTAFTGSWAADSFDFGTFTTATTFDGYGGNDTITVRNDDLTIRAGVGFDTVAIAGSVFDWDADWMLPGYIRMSDGNVEYDCWSVEGFQFSNFYAPDYAALSAWSGSGSGDAIGGFGNVDIFMGLGGNDWLLGGAGDDALDGGDDDDVLEGEDDNDLLSGGNGADDLYGGNGIDRLHGGAGSDLLQGNDGDDTLYGDADGDTLQGGNGLDLLYGGTGADALYGDAGVDSLYGEDGGDGLFGGDGNDLLVGGAGDDDLFGGNNNDVLVGGAGYDYLYGNAGADTFVFEDVEIGTTYDVIWDFNLSHGDKIDFSDLLTAYDPLTHAIADFVDIQVVSGDTLIGVDKDGTGSTHGFELVVAIENVVPPSTNPQDYINSGVLIV